MIKINKGETSILDRAHPFYFAIPACIVLFVFYLLPILLNLGYAFTDWSAYKPEVSFVGFANFRELIREGIALRVFKNSMLFTISMMILQNGFGFLLALMLEKKNKINTLIRIIIFTPCVVGAVIWGFLFSTILSRYGLLNSLLSRIFFTEVAIPWLGSVDFTIFTVGMVNAWMWTGFTMMIYINSINAIPQEVTEAAKIDGVNWFGMIKNVVIPLIMPGITINVVLSAIGGLKIFDLILALTRGGPAQSTEVFNTVIYEKFSSGLLGYSASLNLLLIVFIAAIAFPLYIKLSSKVVEA